jgi:hypothetical protein
MIDLNDTRKKGRIRSSALCMLDHEMFHWPNMPEHLRQENFSPDTIFVVLAMPRGLMCWADGYDGGVFGRPGKYGNGAVLLYHDHDIEVIHEQDQIHRTTAAKSPDSDVGLSSTS